MDHSGLKGWQRRYCVLKDGVLYIFKKMNDKDCLNKVVMPSYAVVPDMGSATGSGTSSRMWCFKLTHPGCPTLNFSAESKEDLAHCVSIWTLATLASAKDGKRRRILAQR